MAHRQVFSDGIRLDKSGPGDVDLQAQGDPGTADSFIIEVEPTSATSARLRYNSATNQWEIRSIGGAFSPISTGASSTLDGAYDGGGSGLGRSITVDAGAVLLDNRQTNGTILNINSGAAVVADGALTGISVDMLTNITPSGQDLTGISIIMVNDAAGAGPQSNAISIDNRMVAGSVIEISSQGAVNQGTLLRGLLVNLDTNVTTNGFDQVGIEVNIGDTGNAGTRAILVDSAQTAGSYVDLSPRGAVTLTGELRGLDINLRAGLSQNAQTIKAIEILITGDQNTDRVIDIDAQMSIGTWIEVSADNPVVLTGVLSGMVLDLSTNFTGGANDMTGLTINVATDGAGIRRAIVTDNHEVMQDGRVGVGSFTVAALSAGLAAEADGQIGFASDGRKTGEGVGAGTGVPVYFNADDGEWYRMSDDTIVAA